MRLLIMGPPGAGKGTQAKVVAHRFAVPAISTGEIFRSLAGQTTPLAASVHQVMASGGYVSDELTNAVVADRLAQPDCDGGFLLDGYPRTPAQVDALDRLLAGRHEAIDAVLVLTAHTGELLTRLHQRARIEGRADDDEATIAARLAVYAEQTAPVLELYRQRGLLVEVDGLGSVAEVTDRIAAGLLSTASLWRP